MSAAELQCGILVATQTSTMFTVRTPQTHFIPRTSLYQYTQAVCASSGNCPLTKGTYSIPPPPPNPWMMGGGGRGQPARFLQRLSKVYASNWPRFLTHIKYYIWNHTHEFHWVHLCHLETICPNPPCPTGTCNCLVPSFFCIKIVHPSATVRAQNISQI